MDWCFPRVIRLACIPGRWWVEEVGVEVPVVVRFEGNNAALGRETLDKSGLNIIAAESLTDAAEKAVAAAGGQA